MQVAAMKARPPHIRFIRVPVEDRNASIEAGHPCFVNEDQVVITAPGSKDSVTKPVASWLVACDKQVAEERLPADWAEQFHAAYRHWQRGEELPTNGTPLSVWPGINPAELQNCKSVHILTIEDLAVANDEAMRCLGMGGLSLKQRAKQYLDASAGPGKLTASNLDLEEKLKASESRRMALEERVKELEAQLGVKSPVVATPPDDKLARKL